MGRTHSQDETAGSAAFVICVCNGLIGFLRCALSIISALS